MEARISVQRCLAIPEFDVSSLHGSSSKFGQLGRALWEEQVEDYCSNIRLIAIAPNRQLASPTRLIFQCLSKVIAVRSRNDPVET